MSRKIISVILSLAMALGICSVAFAGPGDPVTVDRTDEIENDHTDTSVVYAGNSFTDGNLELMTVAQKAVVDGVIESFMNEYINDDMSDFEKEMIIIQYLVENCEFKVGTGINNATAYNALADGEAQCTGFADAFLQMAKACGLNAGYVCNDDHAWNVIELDGDWYHVDTAWESSNEYGTYGFGNLRNDYINLEDSEMKLIAYHNSWTPAMISCNGYKYGPEVVAGYLKTGKVDTSLSRSFEDFLARGVIASANDFEKNYSNSSPDELIDFMIILREPDTNRCISAIIGRIYGNERISIDYPDGYTYSGLRAEENFTVRNGSAIFSGDSIMVLAGDSDDTFMMEITLTEK